MRSTAEAPVRERDGLISRILLQEGDVPGVGLTVTRVEVAPGSRQRLHYHDAEQVYLVLEGRGKMRVGDEEREVEQGDLLYIPSGMPHGIQNVANEPLEYVSAATPAMDALAAYDTGQLSPEGMGEDT